MECSRGSLLGGRVAYLQPVRGYRTGIEPVLLAASVPARAGQRVLEAGTGAGAGLLCLHARVAGLDGAGVERDPEMAALARTNLAANGAAFAVLVADVTALPALPPFDHVFANPPWHEPGSTRSPDRLRDAATHRGAGGIGVWVAALGAVLREGGTLTLALPAALMADGVAALHEAGLRRLVLWPLWPRASVAAKIVLVQAVRGAGPSRVGPGLALHGAGSGYSDAAEAILRGGAVLTLGDEHPGG